MVEVNFAYMLFSTIIFMIYGLSFKEKYGVKFSYLANIMLLVRNSIRGLDLEQAKKDLGDNNWLGLLLGQTLIVTSGFVITSILFGNIKHNKKYLVVTSLFAYSCLAYGITKDSGTYFTVGMFVLAFSEILLFSFIWLIGRHIPMIIEQNKIRAKLNNKFKQIY